MKTIWMIAKYTLFAFLCLLGGLTMYALPAMLTLPAGRRQGLEPLTIDGAAQQLRATGKSGWELVEAARSLVAERIQYCRRNSFDPAWRAFERGYGYCQQQAFALVELLTQLGFEARVVQAFRNRFPDGRVGGHAWVRVTVEGISRDIDILHYDPQTGRITHTPLSGIQNYNHLTRVLYAWGAGVVNAYRYYLSGKDYGYE